MDNQVKVGVGVMILKEGKALLGKGKGAHGEGMYASPGGHLDFMESIFDCARREAREETGVEIENIRFVFLENLKIEGKHYVHIEVVADWKSGEPELLEPEKSEGWGWHELDNLPSPLFPSVERYFEIYKTNKFFFDA